MKLSNLFNNWDWLKDSQGTWNFARVTNSVLLLIIQPCVLTYIYLNKELESITNIWQFLVVCSPSIFSTLNFLIEIVRDNKNLSIRIGDSEYSIQKGETGL